MSVDLNKLAGAPEGAAEVDYNNLPEQGGGFAPILQPGRYRFGLPPADAFTDENFIEFDPSPDSGLKGKRLRVKFDSNAPLVVKQAATNPDAVGTPYQTSISSQEMKRGKRDDPKAPMVSDLDYMLAALKVNPRPVGSKAIAQVVLAKAAEGADFAASQEWTWTCNSKRDAYFPDGQGGNQPVPQPADSGLAGNLPGCGKKYYEKDIEKVDGKYPERIACDCGATIRAFGNLRRFEA